MLELAGVLFLRGIDDFERLVAAGTAAPKDGSPLSFAWPFGLTVKG